jgi:hypothetical protein
MFLVVSNERGGEMTLMQLRSVLADRPGNANSFSWKIVEFQSFSYSLEI